MKNKKDKKAVRFLGEHVLNFVIAVIVLILLFGASSKAYGSFQDKNELEKAENNLNNFVAEFDNFMKGAENKTESMILGPEDWYILFYKRWDYRTDKCNEYEFCACFCDGNDKGDCDDKGICAELKYEWKLEGSYKINKIPYVIKLTK